MKTIPLFLTLLISTALAAETSPSVTRSFPRSLGEGHIGDTPFTVPGEPTWSHRYQQIFDASDWSRSGLTAPAWMITKISFGAFSGGTNLVSRHVEIDFSTTHQTPSSLSPVFAENIGPDATLVFSGSITWVPLPPHHPEGGRYEIMFDQPFVYAPSAGNLLMEIRNFEPFTFIDLPFPIASVWWVEGPNTASLWALNANAVSATPSGQGFQLYFTMTPIPEPSTWTLLLSGTALAGLWRWLTRTAYNLKRDGGRSCP
jgi:hypothetical protein